jgi:hypothetical protein
MNTWSRSLRSRVSQSRGGSMGKGREPQIILKTDERNLVFELGARGNSSSSQAVGMTGSSSRTTSSRSQSRTAAGPPSARRQPSEPAGRTLLPDGVGAPIGKSAMACDFVLGLRAVVFAISQGGPVTLR